jgi:hypothetical protein
VDEVSVLPCREGPVGVWGLVNWETTVAVGGFPIVYRPNRFAGGQIASGPSGVAYNIAAALARLGSRPVRLTGLVGRDQVGQIVRCPRQLHDQPSRYLNRAEPKRPTEGQDRCSAGKWFTSVI